MCLQILGSSPFVLGFYGTNNKFSSEEVKTRTLFIKNELDRRGINVISTGTDGDIKFLKSQKYLLEFGKFTDFGRLRLAGDINAENLANQDGSHIEKKMKNIFFDSCDALRMGKRNALSGHLIILIKQFDKNLHNLQACDLNPRDKMNYK